MPKYNVRKNFKDIFGVYFLESLSFEGKYDMPIVGCFDNLEKLDYLALYSDVSDYHKTNNTGVCFYQYDQIFDGLHGLYNSIVYQEEKRLEKFRLRFKDIKYIIAPDYSLYGDFPNGLQLINVYKSRFCMEWLSQNTKAIIIPNIRWTYDYSFEYCLDGIMKGSNIAVGILGQMKKKENKQMFIEGFKKVIDAIEPPSIVAYGFITESNFEEYFEYAKTKGIKIIIPHSKIDKYKKEDAIYGVR